MKKVFASGSCRLIKSVSDGRGKVDSIHSMVTNFYGPNFLAKLHNVKQHIQFIRWIKGEVELPGYILEAFATGYSIKFGRAISHLSPEKLKNLREQFDSCDTYLFEICSVKLYERDGYQVQHEHTDFYTEREQGYDELMSDLRTLFSLIPRGRRIIFQSHFRPNIIYTDPSKKIEKRELLFTAINDFCLQNVAQNYFDDKTDPTQKRYMYLFDPSFMVAKYGPEELLEDDLHFTDKGYLYCFHALLNFFI